MVVGKAELQADRDGRRGQARELLVPGRMRELINREEETKNLVVV